MKRLLPHYHVPAGRNLRLRRYGSVTEGKRDVRKYTTAAFDDLARSLHASYLDRWTRYDVKGTKPIASPQGDPPTPPDPEASKEAEGTSSPA